MNLAKETPELLDSSGNHGSHLPSINTAIAILNASEEIQEKSAQKQENGEKIRRLYH